MYSNMDNDEILKYGFFVSKENSSDHIWDNAPYIANPRFTGVFIVNDMSDKKRGMMWATVHRWLNDNNLEYEMDTSSVMLLFTKK